MGDTLRVCAWAMVVLILVDPDGSVWRLKSNERAYAQMLVECLNGRGFAFGNAAVLCDVTHVEVRR